MVERTVEGIAAARSRRAERTRGMPSAAVVGTVGSAAVGRTARGSAAGTAGTAGSAEEGIAGLAVATEDTAGSVATAGTAGSAAAAGTAGAGSPPRRSWRTRPSGTLIGDRAHINVSARKKSNPI